MKTQKEKNKELILAAIEDCKKQRANGYPRHKCETGLQSIGFNFELSTFIASVAYSN